MLRSTYRGLSIEVAASGFAVGGAHPDECGPAGMVFGPGDSWLVANCGTGELFTLAGGETEVGDPLSAHADVLDLAADPEGRLFGSAGTAVVELDPTTGRRLRLVADGFSELAGLVYDRGTDRLIVADFVASSIVEVDAASGDQRVVVEGDRVGRPDGLVLDTDGHIFAAAYGSHHVLAIDATGAVHDLGFLPGGPDGIALGHADGPFANTVIVNQRDGSVVALDEEGAVVRLAEGGTPGDLLAVDPGGYLYVTQHHEVLRIGPPWFALQPWRYLPGATPP